MSPTVSGNKSLRNGYANQGVIVIVIIIIIIIIIIMIIIIYLYSACTFQY